MYIVYLQSANYTNVLTREMSCKIQGREGDTVVHVQDGWYKRKLVSSVESKRVIKKVLDKSESSQRFGQTLSLIFTFLVFCVLICPECYVLIYFVSEQNKNWFYKTYSIIIFVQFLKFNNY